MSIYEITVIGFALSLDAFAVTVSNLATYKNLTKDKLIMMPVFFSLFQGCMPLIGFFAGSIVSPFVCAYSDYIAFAIFFILASKILFDILSDKVKGEARIEKVDKKATLSYKILFLQSIATSIDALAVGITFIGSSVNIYIAISVIMAVTAVVIVIGVFIGKFLGDKLGNKAQIIGMLILYAVALKSLIEGIV